MKFDKKEAAGQPLPFSAPKNPQWVMLAALIAKRAAAGWIGALALPLAMYGIRAAIPATSHLNVIKYANMVSLLQINELLGNYRNLFWFGSPISLP